MTTVEQEAHRVEMSRDSVAVGVLDLNDAAGALAFIGRNLAGEVQAVRVVDGAGDELDDARALELLIATRARHQREETQATEAIRANLLRMRAAGAALNVAKLARETGIARSTIYSWLDDAPVAA